MSADDSTGSQQRTSSTPSTPLFSWVKAELKAKPEGVNRALLLLEGALELESLGRVGEAAKAMVASANCDPLLLPAVWRLIYVFIKRSSWDNIKRLREAEGKAAQLPAEKALALVSLGELYEDRLGDIEAAAESFAQAVEIAPEDRTALLTLERATSRAGDLGRLAQALAHQIDQTDDDQRRALLLIDLAQLQESIDRGSTSQAIELLREAASIEQGQWHWLGVLERFAERVDLPAASAEALEGRAAIMASLASLETAGEAARTGAPRVKHPADAAHIAAALYRQAARVRDVALGDREAAIEDLRWAHEMIPGERVTFESLLNLLERAGQREEAARLLAIRIEAEPAADDLQALQLRSAEVLASLGDHETAIEHFTAALESSPAALIPAVGLSEVLVTTERFDELAAHYEKTAAAVGDESPALATLLLVRAAEVKEIHLVDREGARDLLTAAEEISPRPELIQRRIVSLFGALGQWREAAELLGRMIEAAGEDPAAVPLLTELALIQQVHLSDLSGAADSYGALLQRDPEASWALVLQAELAAAAERWVDTARAYRRLAELEMTEEQAAACAGVAGWLLFCRGDRPEEAEECFRLALERRPDSALAAAGLEVLARETDDAEGLQQLLRDRADRATVGSEVERLLLALALEHEKAGELDEAVVVYRELVDRAESPISGRWGLARCYRRQERWQELADILLVIETDISSRTERGAVLLELAEIYLDRLGHPAMAEDALRRAREADADLLPAVIMLADAARMNGAWDELDELLQEMLRLAPETALLVAEERLAVAAGPGQQDETAGVITDVLLENIPDHRPALLHRALLGARRRDAAARCSAWLELAGHEAEPEVRAQLVAHALVIGRINGLDIGWIPPDDQPLDPAVAFHLAEAPPAELPVEHTVDALRQRRDLCVEPTSKAFWTLELADTLEALGQIDEATAEYREVADTSPDSIGALEGLRRTARASERWRDLAEVCEQLAELYDGEAAGALWAEAGWAWERVEGEEERLELACRRAMALDPSQVHPFSVLIKRLGEQGEREEQIDLLDRRMGAVDEPTELVTLLVAQAGLYRDLGRNADASGCLETALLVDSENLEAHRARAALDVADQRWTAAAESLEAWATATDGEERRIVRWRAAELIDQQLGNPISALDPLLSLEKDGDHDPETFRRLLYTARRAKLWSVAVRAAGRVADLTDDDHEELESIRLQAMLYESPIGDQAAARTSWMALVSKRPQDVQAMERLIELSPEAERAPTLSGLSAHLNAQLRSEPASAEVLRAVLKMRQLAGSVDGELCVLRVLDALGLADLSEQERLEAMTKHLSTVAQRPLSAESFSRIKHPDQTGFGESLHILLAPVLHKIYAADASAMSLGRPLKPRGAELLVERLRGAAEVFGLDKIVIRPSSSDEVAIVAVPASEPTLAVGPRPGGELSASERFALGRAVWHALQATAPYAQRTESQIRALHDAAIKEADRSFEPSERRLGVEALQREIHRHLPRKARKSLNELAAKMVRADEAPLRQWCRAVKASADRAGLLFAGDVAAALHWLVPGWRGDDAAQRAASVDRVVAHLPARELLLFALSEDYLELRQEIGLALESW